jgi:hypothetical protein
VGKPLKKETMNNLPPGVTDAMIDDQIIPEGLTDYYDDTLRDTYGGVEFSDLPEHDRERITELFLEDGTDFDDYDE